MRNLKCEFCGKKVKEIDEEYLAEYPLAAGEWMTELLQEHYDSACDSCPTGQRAGMASGILK